ncbi:MAG: DUF2924 domain-containing protein [Alphaproteobacteria bacterium]|nr:DUF2924 domain-containing protein [Alphaproteobacteria bacterium]
MAPTPRANLRAAAASVLAAWDDQDNRDTDIIAALEAPMEALRALLAEKAPREATARRRQADRRHPVDPRVSGRRARRHRHPRGYDYQGRPYQSLSAIARGITGTRWNGRVFFGLRPSRGAA